MDSANTSWWLRLGHRARQCLLLDDVLVSHAKRNGADARLRVSVTRRGLRHVDMDWAGGRSKSHSTGASRCSIVTAQFRSLANAQSNSSATAKPRKLGSYSRSHIANESKCPAPSDQTGLEREQQSPASPLHRTSSWRPADQWLGTADHRRSSIVVARPHLPLRRSMCQIPMAPRQLTQPAAKFDRGRRIARQLCIQSPVTGSSPDRRASTKIQLHRRPITVRSNSDRSSRAHRDPAEIRPAMPRLLRHQGCSRSLGEPW